MEFFKSNKQEEATSLKIEVAKDTSLSLQQETSNGFFKSSNPCHSDLMVSEKELSEALSKASSAEGATIMAGIFGAIGLISSIIAVISKWQSLPTGVNFMLLGTAIMSLSIILVAKIGIELIPNTYAKKHILHSTILPNEGKDLYIVDENNQIRCVYFRKSECFYDSDNDSLAFWYEVSLDGNIVYIDNSKIFYNFMQAQEYSHYQAECIKNAIYSVMRTQEDAERILNDDEFGDIFYIFACSSPTADTTPADKWTSAAHYHARKYLYNPLEYMNTIASRYTFSDTDEEEVHICPLYQRESCFWETGKATWEGEERSIRDFIMFYKAFKEEEKQAKTEVEPPLSL